MAFKHHSYFPKAKAVQTYRFPYVCFACRKSFKYPAQGFVRYCPQCRAPMEMLSRKFSAPKQKDRAQWQKVEYLVKHGFRFHAVFEPAEGGGHRRVPYPKTLEEAKVFVQKYQYVPQGR